MGQNADGEEKNIRLKSRQRWEVFVFFNLGGFTNLHFYFEVLFDLGRNSISNQEKMGPQNVIHYCFGSERGAGLSTLVP